MKFVSLRTKRAHKQGKLGKPSRATHESFAKPNSIVRFDPKTEKMRVVNLPSQNVGIRKMVVDASGRLWYMGSHNGRLGVVE